MPSLFPPSDLPSSLSSNDARIGRLLLWVALFLTLLLFLESLRFGFVYDDRSQILGNPQLASWHGFAALFQGSVWSYDPSRASNYFRPLHTLWMICLYRLFGTLAWGWHLGNLLLHLAVVAMLYLVAAETTRDRIAAGLGTILFSVHPIHSEAVCWISSAPDLLAGLAVLVAYFAFLRWKPPFLRTMPSVPTAALARDQWARRGWCLLSLVLYAGALFSKEIAFFFPLLLLAHCILFAQQGSFLKRCRNALFSALPYAMVVAFYLVVRRRALGGFLQTGVNIPLPAQILGLPLLALFYLRLLFWPAGLGPFYDVPYVLHADLRLFWIPLVALSTITAVAFGLRNWLRLESDSGGTRAAEAFSLWAVWAIIFLLPAFHIASLLPNDFAHDRYLYASSMGICVMAGLLLRRARPAGSLIFGMGIPQAAGFALLSLLLAFATVQQNVYWASDLLLFSRGARIDPKNTDALGNAAASLCERHIYEPCIWLQQEMIARRPESGIAYVNLAHAYLDIGNEESAEKVLSQGAQEGVIGTEQLANLAAIQIDLNKLDRAQMTLKGLSASAPQSAALHLLLGHLLERQGDLKGALREYTEQNLRFPNPEVQRKIGDIQEKLKVP